MERIMTGDPTLRLDAAALRTAWERQQESSVPERERRFRTMMEVLDSTMPEQARLLDLGCGTGLAGLERSLACVS